MTGGPDLAHNGKFDGWVARVAAEGTHLEFCGYIGGAEDDAVDAVGADPQGRLCAAGWTSSDPATFPVRVGPNLTGGPDNWVARVALDGEGLEFCGYLPPGGLSDLAVDAGGRILVVGRTHLRPSHFPVTVGPDLTFNSRPARRPSDILSDAWIARVRADGSDLEYCGYIGGLRRDYASAVAADSEGRAIVAGYTTSMGGSFPVTGGPSRVYQGDGDGWVARITADGRRVEACGYLGGAGFDAIDAMTLAPGGAVLVAGETLSGPNTFPLRIGPSFDPGPDRFPAFVARLEPLDGAPAGGRLLAVPRTVDAGILRAGASRTVELTVRNAGRARLVVGVPPLPAPFEVREPGSLTLAAGERRRIPLRFAPQAPGFFESALTLTSSDGRRPLTHVYVTGVAR